MRVVENVVKDLLVFSFRSEILASIFDPQNAMSESMRQLTSKEASRWVVNRFFSKETSLSFRPHLTRGGNSRWNWRVCGGRRVGT